MQRNLDNFSFLLPIIKQNHYKTESLFNITFVQTVALKTRKSDDFRELHVNEPEMAALGVKRIMVFVTSYLACLLSRP